MSWRVVFGKDVELDVAEAVAWYEVRQRGLGAAFVEEIITVWDELAINPLLNSRRYHPEKDIRWRLTNRFPYQSGLRGDGINSNGGRRLRGACGAA